MAGKKLAASLLAFAGFIASAQVVGKGDYAITDSVKNACHMAELRAISDASFKSFGKTVTTNQTKVCISCDLETSVSVNTNAIVEKIISKDVLVENGICSATVNVVLRPESFLNVSVKGEDIHQSGKPIEYKIYSKNSLYLYVFATHSEKLDILFPLDYNNQKVEGKLVFPTDMNLRITPRLFEGQTEAVDRMYFLFTTIPLDFDRDNMSVFQLHEIVDALPSNSKRFFKRETLIVGKL